MFSRQVTVKTSVPINTRHIDDFIKLKCSPELIHSFPNAKEITESMAVLNSITKIKGLDYDLFKREDVLCIIPGDGVFPRTGCLTALRTNWQVISIDPLMKVKHPIQIGDNNTHVERLRCLKKKRPL